MNIIMNFNPIRVLVNAKPLTLILAITLLKLIFLFAVLPLFEASLGSMYGISFADNYHMLAQNLAAGNGYRFTDDTALTMMREPGYPLVLAALFSVFGYGLSAPRVANLFFGIFSALLISRITRQVSGSERAAKLAPVLFLVHPGVIITDMRGGVEGLFIMLVMCFLVVTYKALASGRLKDYFFVGLALGIASIVRSTVLLFPSFLLLYFLWWERTRTSIPAMLSRVVIVWVGAFLILSPWIIRNYALSGHFVPTGSVAGVSAHAGQYICTHFSFDNSLEKVDGDAATERVRLAREQGYRFKELDGLYYLYFYKTQDELAFNTFLGKRVLQRYLESPMLLLECSTKNAFNFWFSGKTWKATTLNSVVQLPYLLLAIAGLIIGMRSKRSADIAILALFIVYTMGVYLPILAEARYSMHLIPILSILAALPFTKRRWKYSSSNEQ
ncbi:MAG: ArnT family glycosyltransferase [Steroidobacteraceae bacterium]